MRSEDRKLAWSVVVVLIVLALEFAWFLFFGPPPNSAANQEANRVAYQWIWEVFGSAAFWTALFTGLLTWSTWLLWRATRDTLSHAREDAARQSKDAAETVAIAKRAADASVAGQRAWLKISVNISGPLDFGAEQIGPGLNISVTNLGNTPATTVAVSIAIQVDGANQDSDDDWLGVAVFTARELFNSIYPAPELELRRKDVPRGDTYFPGESRRPSLSIVMMASPEDVGRAITAGGGDPSVVFYVIAAVRYTFAGGVGETMEAFHLERTDLGDDAEIWDAFLFDSSVRRYDVGQMKLTKSHLHSYAR